MFPEHFYPLSMQDKLNNWRTTTLILTAIFFLASFLWFSGDAPFLFYHYISMNFIWFCCFSRTIFNVLGLSQDGFSQLKMKHIWKMAIEKLPKWRIYKSLLYYQRHENDMNDEVMVSYVTVRDHGAICNLQESWYGVFLATEPWNGTANGLPLTADDGHQNHLFRILWYLCFSTFVYSICIEL